MPRKTLASVLHEVDPHLKIVSGPKRGRKPPRFIGVPEVQHETETTLDRENWDKAGGARCFLCGQETMRLLPIEKGKLCPSCYQKNSLKEARDMEYVAMSLTYWARRSKRSSICASGQRSP